MRLEKNVSLAKYSTMRLGGRASYAATVSRLQEIKEAVTWAGQKNLPIICVGHGSNIVWRDEGFEGLVLINRIAGRQFTEQNSKTAIIRLGAGETWDDCVAWTVKRGLSGVEALSLIPGTAGATPVQNVGAYGQEIAQTLVELEAYDVLKERFTSIANADCGFGYRTSRFKTADRGRFIIASVTLKLSLAPPRPPFYEAVRQYFDRRGIANPNAADLRAAVVAIRGAKLPDPAKTANCGSFFANPIVSADQLERLRQAYPEIKFWPQPDGNFKLAAAWLVERAGFKGIHDRQTGMATWPVQALVFINERAESTADLLAFKAKVSGRVEALFGVSLIQEPELLP